MATAETITQKLVTAFQPTEIDVQDVSHQHAGHAGWREGGGTHFDITMRAAAFAGKSRVQTHRMVNTVLAEDLAGTVHAVQLHLSA